MNVFSALKGRFCGCAPKLERKSALPHGPFSVSEDWRELMLHTQLFSLNPKLIIIIIIKIELTYNIV